MKQRKLFSVLVSILAFSALIAGCAPAGPKLCRREALARPEMQVDFRAHHLSLDDHIYFSKEASSGGRGLGGGGCGCN